MENFERKNGKEPKEIGPDEIILGQEDGPGIIKNISDLSLEQVRNLLNSKKEKTNLFGPKNLSDPERIALEKALKEKGGE